jgi:hypothetical protein
MASGRCREVVTVAVKVPCALKACPAMATWGLSYQWKHVKILVLNLAKVLRLVRLVALGTPDCTVGTTITYTIKADIDSILCILYTAV